MKSAWLEIKNGKIAPGMNLFLQRLLQGKLLDALLVLVEFPTKSDVAPALVTDPGVLTKASPLAPVMPVSLARVVSSLTRVAPSRRKIGVVLRPCEIRVLVELVKLKQASLENLVLIGMDCFGTYSLADYRQFCEGSSAPVEEFLQRAKNGDALNLREACQVCEYFPPLNADLVIGLFGVDPERQVLLQAMTPEGERILEALQLPEGLVEGRETAISELRAKRVQKKEELLGWVQREMAGLGNLLHIFAPCINCHNCRVACPICYCKECLFDSSTFELEGDKYFIQAEKKGALRMPSNTLFFHLGRLTHMSLSCVGCGLCQEACPSSIPLFPLFRFVGAKVQELFEYMPGRSLEEELPLTMFREEELSWIGQ